jgi:hypothetical protein
MKPQRFEFQGQMLTIREIHERVPAISDTAIRNHLKAERCTTVAMLQHNYRGAQLAGAKRGARARTQAQRIRANLGFRT